MKLKNLLSLFLVVGFHTLLHGSQECSWEVENVKNAFRFAAEELGNPVLVKLFPPCCGRSAIEIFRNLNLAQDSINRSESCDYKVKYSDYNVSYIGVTVVLTAYVPQAEPVPVPVAVPVESCCIIS